MSEANTVTSDMLATWLKERIQTGQFVPGQRLVEIDLIASSGATRAIIRKTFQKLAGEGILTIEPYRGAIVRRLDAGEIRDAYAVREVLAGLAARLAAGARDRDALSNILEDAARAVTADDHSAFIAVNRRWHSEILRIANNPELTSHLERSHVTAIHLLVRAYFDRSITVEAERSQARVTRAILAGDAEAAEKYMRLHVRAGFHAVETADEHEGHGRRQRQMKLCVATVQPRA